MDERETLEARLKEAGVADTAALPIGATLRPSGLDATIPSEPSAAPPRALPRLSVDLRGSMDDGASGSEPPGDVGADLEVCGVLGEGGMGRVLLARQHSLQREVAVKTARDSDSSAASQAILAEGAVAGRLEHPAIVPVHALGIDAAGRPAIVMKRIEGVSWRELARDPGHPGWEGWDGDADDRLPGHLQILSMICNAVRYAHSRGVVHRDIKLENVLIGRFGDVYLADWGVAAHIGEESSRLCGTPGYMAPEMVTGRRVDERTDVYLLGATLHEILTGQTRHSGPHAVAALLHAMESEPHEFGDAVPRELGALVNRACSADPPDRFAGAGELREALHEYESHEESRVLAAEGVERVAQAEALASAPEMDEDARRELDRTITEARFGLDQALARWPDNAEAQGARARLDELLEARRARAAALEREAHERDPRVAARSRAWALTGMALFTSLLTAPAAFMEDVTTVGWQLIAYPFAVLFASLVGTAVLRRAVLATAFNRRLVLSLFAMILAMIAERVVGVSLGQGTVEMFTRDCFLMASGLAVVAIAFVPWVGWLALIYVICGALLPTFPDHALQIFVIASNVALFVAAGFQWRSALRSEPS